MCTYRKTAERTVSLSDSGWAMTDLIRSCDSRIPLIGRFPTVGTHDVAGCTFDLSGRSIHVWPVRIERPNAVFQRFERFLSPDEKDRAARLRFEDLRYSFIIARGVLRILLGHYLTVSPISVQFKYGPRGKPALAVPRSIDFNVSHSGSFVVFAFAATCQ